jgi:hypothetical protein
MSSLISYSSIRSNIVKIFPLNLIQKYLINYRHNLETEIIPNSIKDPAETIISFFKMNNTYYNIYDIRRSSDTEFLHEDNYECSSVDIFISGFPFSNDNSRLSMGTYNFIVKLHTFKCSEFTETVMYIDFTTVRYLSLYFVTITKLINIINKIDTNTDNNTDEEYLCYSDREQLLLFLNGFSSGGTNQKKYRVLGDPFWHRSVSEYLCYDNYIIDYKGEDCILKSFLNFLL